LVLYRVNMVANWQRYIRSRTLIAQRYLLNKPLLKLEYVDHIESIRILNAKTFVTDTRVG